MPDRSLLATVLTIALAVSACGGSDVTAADTAAEVATEEPASSSSAQDQTATITTANEATATGSLFDTSVIHSIAVEVDDAAVADMLETFVATGEKEWLEATVTIDGVTYENVGIKLKGNSSLRDTTVNSSPEDLPWRIRLDKYVDGQDHEGYVELAVRSNNTESSLNEAVALELLGDAGLSTELSIATGFSVNGTDPTLRLVVQIPDDVWMAENFSADGALYKAESTGDYTYRGDDPDAYDEVFDQEAGDDNADLTPLIEFLDFVNNTDDATFSAELADHLDVEAFATYLAMMDLVDNFDDIDGPGNNSYLYYDTTTGVFTVVPWDFNLAFGVQNGGGGGDATAAGGGGGGFGGRGERPAGDGAAVAGGPAGRGGDGSNVLAERFRADADFAALYEAALADLEAELFTSGHAQDVLEAWVATLSGSDLIDAETLAAEAAAIEASIA